jgi:hypothetical protein
MRAQIPYITSINLLEDAAKLLSGNDLVPRESAAWGVSAI